MESETETRDRGEGRGERGRERRRGSRGRQRMGSRLEEEKKAHGQAALGSPREGLGLCIPCSPVANTDMP